VCVLVVDDEEGTRDALDALLVSAGADVRVCASTAEALATLARWDADVLVVDIAMPGEDGYELLRRVRARPRGGDVPALALTAYARPEDRDQALAGGFQDFIAKPVDPPALVEAIARLYGSRVEVAAPPPEAPAADVRGWGETVLLVEDDPGTREYGRAVLQEYGYRVLAADGGEQGLGIWAAHRDEIDVVVTDLVMLPGISGQKVWNTVHAERAEVPVIVVSGYPLVAEMLEARHGGVVECLEKPVEPADLVAAVRRALGQARLH
jgi:CheY-like chemotaxis protein